MPDETLLLRITDRRAHQALEEAKAFYPEACMSYEVAGGRGVITVCEDRFIISREFVETDDSIYTAGRLSEYARVLLGRSRLVVVVPRDKAARTWLRLLELNNYWLFYHQLICYDAEGNLEPIDRLAWRRLMGLAPERTEDRPEVA